MLTKEYIVMLLIGIDLAFMSLYVVSIWFVQRKIRNTSKSFRHIYRQGEIRKMKTLAIRTLVVALAVAGFSASTMYSATTARRTSESKTLVAAPGMVSTPNPQCGPGHACGID
jgi:hypothetical protein